jgi:hypothetical protein
MFCSKHYDECRAAGKPDNVCTDDLWDNHMRECGYVFM